MSHEYNDVLAFFGFGFFAHRPGLFLLRISYFRFSLNFFASASRVSRRMTRAVGVALKSFNNNLKK